MTGPGLRRPRLSRIVAGLPTEIPFVAPEVMERQTGRPFRVRIGANESSFGMSPIAIAAMERELPRASWYGDPESTELRGALAVLLDVQPACVAVACGIDDLQSIAVRAYMDPGDVAVMSRGAYPTFAYHVVGVGATVHAVPYGPDDRNDVEALAAAARATSARVCFLANPDNPSGSWLEGTEVEALLRALPDDCLLVLDEAYLEFGPPGGLPLDVADPRLIRFRTFSKAYGMAGLRIGYALGERSLLAPFEGVRLHFGVSRVAQAGALAALSDVAFLRGVVAAVAEGRDDYHRLAQGLGLTSLASHTNFVAIDLGSRERAAAAMEGLLTRGIFIRKPGDPPLDRCIRVTVGTPEERALLETALAEVLTEGRAAG